MFVTNPISLSNTYKTTSKIVKDYLINNNIPLLSNKEGIFYFSYTNKFEMVLEKSPFWIKILI